MILQPYLYNVWLQNHNDTLYFNCVILLYPLCLNILESIKMHGATVEKKHICMLNVVLET